MSRAIQRLRLKQYLDKLDQLHGDAAEDAGVYAPLALSALAEVTQKAAAARDAAQKKKAIDEAQKKLDDARVSMATANAKEKDPNGPLHIAANQAVNDAQNALTRLISTGGLAPTGDAGGKKGGRTAPSEAPWWKWPAIIGGGGVVALLGYKLLKRK